MRLPGRYVLTCAGATVCIVAIASTLFLRSPKEEQERPAVAEIPIPEPFWGELEREAREHVRRVREQLLATQEAAESSTGALADAYGELGKAFLAYDLPASAVPCFQNASRLEADEFLWPYLQARAHHDLLDTGAAADSMTEAIRRQRRSPATPIILRVAALCFLGEADLRLMRRDDARSCFNEALRLAPDSVFALFKRGQLASQTGDSESAIRDFQAALSLFPAAQPRPILLALATDFQKLGRTQEAARFRRLAATGASDMVIRFFDPLEADIQARNRRPSAVRARARAALEQGELPAALEHLDSGLELAPNQAELLLLRGQTLRQMGRLPEALRDLQAAKQYAPNEEPVRVVLIEVLALSQETIAQAWQEAVAWRDERPDALRPQLMVAALDFQQGRFEDALGHYTAAAGKFPGDVSPRLGAIISLCALGRYDAARSQFTVAMASFPEDADLKHQFARFLVTCPDAAARDPQRGLAMIQELSSGDTALPLQETLVCALAACGQEDEARRVLAMLIQAADAQRQPSLNLRFRRIDEAIRTGRPWTESWPFAETDARAPAAP